MRRPHRDRYEPRRPHRDRYEQRRRAARRAPPMLPALLGVAALVLLGLLALPRLNTAGPQQPAAVQVSIAAGHLTGPLAAQAAPVAASTAVPLPARQPPQGSSNGPFPILMYHYIRDVDPAVDQLGYGLSISPAAFAEQMGWLAQNGYTTLRMDEFTACIQAERGCPERSVALTFDDGYTDALTAALPVLQQHGFTATFYIINSRVGQPGYLTWDELAAIRDAGMELGAHTIDHLNLTDLDSAEAFRQMAESKSGLESALGIPITSLCYPAGFYSDSIAAQAAEAGFSNATTTRWDNDYSSMWMLPRRRMSGGMSLDQFAGTVLN